MQQYDVRLKSILHRAMPRLFGLLGLPPIAEYLTVEFPLRQKVVSDMVVRLIDSRILHVELQSKNDPRMLWRCLEYWQAIAELWPDADIIQVVIYLGDSPAMMISKIARGKLTYEFDIISLKDVDANAFLESESAGERMLAILCRSEDPRATIAAILASWLHLPAQELSENIQDLFLLSQLRKQGRMVREESTAVPIEIDITENELYKWGQERGEAAGEAKILTRLLERRFGHLPDTIRTKIGSASIESLDQWVDRLDAAATLDAVFADLD